MERFGKHCRQRALPATRNPQVRGCKSTHSLWHWFAHPQLTHGRASGRKAPCPHEAQLAQRGDTFLVWWKTGSTGRERNKKQGLQAGRPKQLFLVGWGSKGTFPSRGKTMTSQGPPWEIVWCSCKPPSCRKLLEETARLEERLQPEKTSWQWVVAVKYLFLINLPQPVDLAFLWERFSWLPFTIFFFTL